MRIAIAGATGFLGRALAGRLSGAGHSIVRIGRGRVDGTRVDVRWDPERGQLDAAALGDVDAVVNLSGESIAERWTRERKRRIRDSRVKGTELLARTIAALPSGRQRVFLSGSAVGIYGNRGSEELDEKSALGDGFLGDTAREWEAAALPARQSGARVVHPRLGIVLNPGGGVLSKMLPVFKLGAGGRAGTGTQFISWIALDDMLGAFEHLLVTQGLHGPVNVTSPHPVTNAQFAKTLAEVIHRPALAPVPAFAIRLMFGEMGEETLLASQRVLPNKLLAAGFTFRHPTLEQGLKFELARA